MQFEYLESWGIGFNEVDGLDHLEGELVSILCDGGELKKQVVIGGKVSLSADALKVHVGLGYQSIGKTLPMNLQTKSEITTKNKVKAINNVNMEIYESVGVWAGTKLDKDNMYEIKARDSEPYGMPVVAESGIISIDVSSSYNKPGQFYFMQSSPLPLSILSLIPEVTSGG